MAAQPALLQFEMKAGEATLSTRVFATVPLNMTQVESPLPLASYAQAETAPIERPTRMEFGTQVAAQAMTAITRMSHAALSNADWKVGPETTELRLRDLFVNDKSPTAKDGDTAELLVQSPRFTLLWQGRSYTDETSGQLTFDVDAAVHLVLHGLKSVGASGAAPLEELYLEKGRTAIAVHRVSR